MRLETEMFVSVWHLAVPVLVLIAFIGMVAGGYDRRTTLKSTGWSLVVFYAFVTFTTVIVSQESLYVEEKMVQDMDEYHAEIKDRLPFSEAPGIVAYVGAFLDEDDGTKWVIYAGNYGSAPFTGTVSVTVTDEDRITELLKRTFEEVHLAPGEKKELDTVYSLESRDNPYLMQFKAAPASGTGADTP
ncbi:hypothetical protein ACH6EH_08585 [Paenibacillus sp. JSM ZJ436]|uniref:hypothetical protein n=1 Tax=Paenibacillus sp. JSM ZJ436 TaxID=3376190 RepID=UPI00378E6827